MNAALLIFFGGGLGAVLRHGVNRAAAAWFGLGFPVGTLTVNVVGSLLMGLFAAWFAEGTGASQELRLFLTTGLLGGFTTFSAFSLDALMLWERGETLGAVGYVAASVLLSLGAVALGFAAAR